MPPSPDNHALPQHMENVVIADFTDVVLTIEEAAKRLRIGRTLMYSLVMSGEIRSVSIGRLRRVPVRCLDEYVNTLLGQSQPQPVAHAA
jgi:excisionase family DNA binding protein